jgi:hypothetical protein
MLELTESDPHNIVQNTTGAQTATRYPLGAIRMPPTLRCTASIPSTCAKKLCRAGQSTRSFSTTPPQDQRVTRNRRQLFRWLGSQGQNFLNPLNGSTNYLGAYNAQGQLKRAVEAAAEAEKKKQEEGKAKDPAKGSAPEPEDEDKEFKGKILPETTRDLQPFPLNRSFVSQPVLSDELREEIWKKVMQDGKSVRQVSAELTVEMSRVGAVVRLKEIEKEWEQTVCSTGLFVSPHLYDDLLKNRLVFKTNTWLQNLRMRASLKVLSPRQL